MTAADDSQRDFDALLEAIHWLLFDGRRFGMLGQAVGFEGP